MSIDFFKLNYIWRHCLHYFQRVPFPLRKLSNCNLTSNLLSKSKIADIYSVILMSPIIPIRKAKFGQTIIFPNFFDWLTLWSYCYIIHFHVYYYCPSKSLVNKKWFRSSLWRQIYVILCSGDGNHYTNIKHLPIIAHI